MTNETNTLTTKERTALILIVKNAQIGCGCDSIEELEGDNFSWFDTEDLAPTFNKHEASGLISALEDKGIIQKDGDWFLDNPIGLDKWVPEINEILASK